MTLTEGSCDVECDKNFRGDIGCRVGRHQRILGEDGGGLAAGTRLFRNQNDTGADLLLNMRLGRLECRFTVLQFGLGLLLLVARKACARAWSAASGCFPFNAAPASARLRLQA